MTILKDGNGNPTRYHSGSRGRQKSGCWILAARSLRPIGGIPIGRTTRMASALVPAIA